MLKSSSTTTEPGQRNQGGHIMCPSTDGQDHNPNGSAHQEVNYHHTLQHPETMILLPVAKEPQGQDITWTACLGCLWILFLLLKASTW